jgi:hypothetical protein
MHSQRAFGQERIRTLELIEVICAWVTVCFDLPQCFAYRTSVSGWLDMYMHRKVDFSATGSAMATGFRRVQCSPGEGGKEYISQTRRRVPRTRWWHRERVGGRVASMPVTLHILRRAHLFHPHTACSGMKIFGLSGFRTHGQPTHSFLSLAPQVINPYMQNFGSRKSEDDLCCSVSLPSTCCPACVHTVRFGDAV